MQYLSHLTGCLIFFFEHFLSLQRYPKTGEVRGLKDMRQIEQREVGKMENKVVKATEGIMDETGTICIGKQKVKVQGGKYFKATKYSRDATCF